MIAAPKPPVRAPKPRKAIARVSPRRKTTKKIPPWKRNPDRYCTEGRCHRPRRALMRCATHAVKELDSMWGRLVRAKGECEGCGKREGLQAAHGHSRRYGPTRWLLLNGFCLCHGCHVRWTHDPLGWTEFLRKAWGETVYEEMRRLALSGGRPDYELTFATLAEAALSHERARPRYAAALVRGEPRAGGRAGARLSRVATEIRGATGGMT